MLPDFAVAVYRREGVSAACLELQERHGADVNIVLAVAYSASVRRHVVTEAEVATLRAAVHAWHRDVVAPLRAVRRRLKTGPPPAPDESTARLRSNIQRDEIEAELIELTTLAGLIDDLPVDTDPADRGSLGTALRRVLPALGPGDHLAVDVICTAALDEAQA